MLIQEQLKMKLLIVILLNLKQLILIKPDIDQTDFDNTEFDQTEFDQTEFENTETVGKDDIISTLSG